MKVKTVAEREVHNANRQYNRTKNRLEAAKAVNETEENIKQREEEFLKATERKRKAKNALELERANKALAANNNTESFLKSKSIASQKNAENQSLSDRAGVFLPDEDITTPDNLNTEDSSIDTTDNFTPVRRSSQEGTKTSGTKPQLKDTLEDLSTRKVRVKIDKNILNPIKWLADFRREALAQGWDNKDVARVATEALKGDADYSWATIHRFIEVDKEESHGARDFGKLMKQEEAEYQKNLEIGPGGEIYPGAGKLTTKMKKGPKKTNLTPFEQSKNNPLPPATNREELLAKGKKLANPKTDDQDVAVKKTKEEWAKEGILATEGEEEIETIENLEPLKLTIKKTCDPVEFKIERGGKLLVREEIDRDQLPTLFIKPGLPPKPQFFTGNLFGEEYRGMVARVTTSNEHVIVANLEEVEQDKRQLEIGDIVRYNNPDDPKFKKLNGKTATVKDRGIYGYTCLFEENGGCMKMELDSKHLTFLSGPEKEQEERYVFVDKEPEVGDLVYFDKPEHSMNGRKGRVEGVKRNNLTVNFGSYDDPIDIERIKKSNLRVLCEDTTDIEEDDEGELYCIESGGKKTYYAAVELPEKNEKVQSLKVGDTVKVIGKFRCKKKHDKKENHYFEQVGKIVEKWEDDELEFSVQFDDGNERDFTPDMLEKFEEKSEPLDKAIFTDDIVEVIGDSVDSPDMDFKGLKGKVVSIFKGMYWVAVEGFEATESMVEPCFRKESLKLLEPGLAMNTGPVYANSTAIAPKKMSLDEVEETDEDLFASVGDKVEIVGKGLAGEDLIGKTGLVSLVDDEDEHIVLVVLDDLEIKDPVWFSATSLEIIDALDPQDLEELEKNFELEMLVEITGPSIRGLNDEIGKKGIITRIKNADDVAALVEFGEKDPDTGQEKVVKVWCPFTSLKPVDTVVQEKVTQDPDNNFGYGIEDYVTINGPTVKGAKNYIGATTFVEAIDGDIITVNAGLMIEGEADSSSARFPKSSIRKASKEEIENVTRECPEDLNGAIEDSEGEDELEIYDGPIEDFCEGVSTPTGNEEGATEDFQEELEDQKEWKKGDKVKICAGPEENFIGLVGVVDRVGSLASDDTLTLVWGRDRIVVKKEHVRAYVPSDEEKVPSDLGDGTIYDLASNPEGLICEYCGSQENVQTLDDPDDEEESTFAVCQSCIDDVKEEAKEAEKKSVEKKRSEREKEPQKSSERVNKDVVNKRDKEEPKEGKDMIIDTSWEQDRKSGEVEITQGSKEEVTLEQFPDTIDGAIQEYNERVDSESNKIYDPELQLYIDIEKFKLLHPDAVVEQKQPSKSITKVVNEKEFTDSCLHHKIDKGRLYAVRRSNPHVLEIYVSTKDVGKHSAITQYQGEWWTLHDTEDKNEQDMKRVFPDFYAGNDTIIVRDPKTGEQKVRQAATFSIDSKTNKLKIVKNGEEPGVKVPAGSTPKFDKETGLLTVIHSNGEKTVHDLSRKVKVPEIPIAPPNAMEDIQVEKKVDSTKVKQSVSENFEQYAEALPNVDGEMKKSTVAFPDLNLQKNVWIAKRAHELTSDRIGQFEDCYKIACSEWNTYLTKHLEN